jgi:hypothetical protein
LQSDWTKFKRPYHENTTQKRAGGVAQMVEHLPSNLEALSSNSIPPKKEKEKIAPMVNEEARLKTLYMAYSVILNTVYKILGKTKL